MSLSEMRKFVRELREVTNVWCGTASYHICSPEESLAVQQEKQEAEAPAAVVTKKSKPRLPEVDVTPGMTCEVGESLLYFVGSVEEFRKDLWHTYIKVDCWRSLRGRKVCTRKPRGKVWKKSSELQEVLDRALAYGEAHVPKAEPVVSPKKKEKVMEPGDYVVPFGKWKGEKLSELPVDSVYWLLQWKEMYAGPRAKIEAYVAWLRTNPERGWISFGKYDGEDLENVPTHYLDWVLGWEEFDSPFLKELIGRVRESRRVWGDVYYDDPSNNVVFARLRTVDLGRVPFDTEGLIPSEARDDKPRPSGWYLSRKFYTNQLELDTSTPKRSAEERAAYPVMFAKVEIETEEGEKVWRSLPRGNDANRDRVDHWAFVLECIDKLEYAGEEDLKERYEDALAAVANLEECERVDARTLDVHGAYRHRKEELESRETPYVELFRDDIQLSQLGRRARGCESVEAFEELCVGLDDKVVEKLQRAYYGAGLHQAPLKG